MSKNVYVFFSDAGHGWLRVKRAELIELGLADKITRYSYARKGWVYLEEDCDASHFVMAKGRNSMDVKFRNCKEYSAIRGYDHYSNGN